MFTESPAEAPVIFNIPSLKIHCLEMARSCIFAACSVIPSAGIIPSEHQVSYLFSSAINPATLIFHLWSWIPNLVLDGVDIREPIIA